MGNDYRESLSSAWITILSSTQGTMGHYFALYTSRPKEMLEMCGWVVGFMLMVSNIFVVPQPLRSWNYCDNNTDELNFESSEI